LPRKKTEVIAAAAHRYRADVMTDDEGTKVTSLPRKKTEVIAAAAHRYRADVMATDKGTKVTSLPRTKSHGCCRPQVQS